MKEEILKKIDKNEVENVIVFKASTKELEKKILDNMLF